MLEKKPSSSASSSTNGRNGGLRQKSKYENILVPDPFSLVQKELQFIADRMRAAQTDLPALANAAEYFQVRRGRETDATDGVVADGERVESGF